MLVKSAHKISHDTSDGEELKNAQSEMRAIDAKIEKLSAPGRIGSCSVIPILP